MYRRAIAELSLTARVPGLCVEMPQTFRRPRQPLRGLHGLKRLLLFLLRGLCLGALPPQGLHVAVRPDDAARRAKACGQFVYGLIEIELVQHLRIGLRKAQDILQQRARGIRARLPQGVGQR